MISDDKYNCGNSAERKKRERGGGGLRQEESSGEVDDRDCDASFCCVKSCAIHPMDPLAIRACVVHRAGASGRGELNRLS